MKALLEIGVCYGPDYKMARCYITINLNDFVNGDYITIYDRTGQARPVNWYVHDLIDLTNHRVIKSRYHATMSNNTWWAYKGVPAISEDELTQRLLEAHTWQNQF